MDERVVQFRVGVMVLASLLITLILVFLFGEGPGIFRSTYLVKIKFTDAPGITPDTPVKKSGVLVGRVSSVDLLDEGGVMVIARIDADKPIRENEVARITTSLLGDSVIHFVDSGRKDLPRTPVKDGAQLEGVAYDDPIQVVAKLQERLAGAIGSITGTSDELGQVAHQVGNLLKANEGKINRMIAQGDETTAMLQQTVRNANEIFGDPETKAKIRDTVNQIPELMRETRDTVRQMQNTMALVDKNLDNLNDFTSSLGGEGKGLLVRLNSSADKLDKLMGELLTFTETLNSGQGSLGRLMTDPELYDNVKRTMANVERLTVEARPIIENAKIFTDKIARHPESIGLRGMVKPSEGTKW